MFAGKTKIKINTKIKIVNSPDIFDIGIMGKITHPFGCFPEGIAGLYINNSTRYRNNIMNLSGEETIRILDSGKCCILKDCNMKDLPKSNAQKSIEHSIYSLWDSLSSSNEQKRAFKDELNTLHEINSMVFEVFKKIQILMPEVCPKRKVPSYSCELCQFKNICELKK